MQVYENGERKEIRVRFAPSPTGSIHVGNMRVAIFNWLFAKNQNGVFILRMEDTDTRRSKMEYADKTIEMLEWLGIEWGEGPLFQSKHTTLYTKIINQLLESQAVYRCFCTEKELDAEREKAVKESRPPLYSGVCRHMDKDTVVKRMENEPYTLRFKVEGDTLEYDDAVRGKTKVDLKLIGDFIVRRCDGSFTYNLAAACDDSMMRISHVLRGEDHISNTPKQILIMKAIGSRPPVYLHLPLIFSPDGRKLSKRDTGGSVMELKESGYLPEAVFKFLSSVGFNLGKKSDSLTREERIKAFSFDKLSLRGAEYDLKKLGFLNEKEIKEMENESMLELAIPFIKEYKKKFAGLPYEAQVKLLSIIKKNISFLTGIDDELAPFFSYNLTSEIKTAMDEYKAKEVVEAFLPECNNADFRLASANASKKAGVKGKEFYMPLRAALTGRFSGPELEKIYDWLKPFERIERLNIFLEYLK